MLTTSSELQDLTQATESNMMYSSKTEPEYFSVPVPVISHNFLKTIAQEYHVSKAELEVLSLAMQGESTAAIASKLSISADAVRKRLSEVYQKFHISGRGPVKLNKLQQLLLKKCQEEPIAPEIVRQPKIDWGNAPDVSVFYGRTEEIAILSHWILDQKCRLVAVLGIGGMGKTVLTVKLAQQIQEQFDHLVWRSLYLAPTLPQLLSNLITTLSQGRELPNLNTIDEQMSWLIDHLRSSRCLIILDGVESILRSGQLAGVYQPGYEIYDQFFRRIAEEPSRSSLLLTSREKIGVISLLEADNSPVRSWQLAGLGAGAYQLLKEKRLSGQSDWESLIQGYRGNPFMLKLAAITIQEVFDGDVTDFINTTLFTHDVSDFVQQLLQRLSEVEAKILSQIAQGQSPLPLPQLREHLSDVSYQDILSAIASLRKRALVEKSERGFMLPPVLSEVIKNYPKSS